MTTFSELNLKTQLLDNLSAAGYVTPTPIQAKTIPLLLEGDDVLGIAQTGTGKTAAFTLPMLQRLGGRDFSLKSGEPRSLILAPTRELASQIKASLDTYGRGTKMKSAVIFGGVGQANQISALRGGLDILVATPGRLLDLMNQGYAKLDAIEIFVLDEADRMLDMGFIHDVKKIIAKLPPVRQTLLFSATMPAEISNLAANVLKNPKRVEVTPPSTTVERIDQRIIRCKKSEKPQLLRKLLKEEGTELTLVFTRTKHGANKVVKYLERYHIHSAAIHGNKSQTAREQALRDFKAGTIKVLVATDIAARGLDVKGVSHVINYDLPVEPESYVHRIGRTGRAGSEGEAISFCDETELDTLRKIEKTIKMKLNTETFIGDPTQDEVINQPLPGQRIFEPRENRSSQGPQRSRGQQHSRQQRPERGPRSQDSGRKPFHHEQNDSNGRQPGPEEQLRDADRRNQGRRPQGGNNPHRHDQRNKERHPQGQRGSAPKREEPAKPAQAPEKKGRIGFAFWKRKKD